MSKASRLLILLPLLLVASGSLAWASVNPKSNGGLIAPRVIVINDQKPAEENALSHDGERLEI